MCCGIKWFGILDSCLNVPFSYGWLCRISPPKHSLLTGNVFGGERILYHFHEYVAMKVVRMQRTYLFQLHIYIPLPMEVKCWSLGKEVTKDGGNVYLLMPYITLDGMCWDNLFESKRCTVEAVHFKISRGIFSNCLEL